MIKLGETQQLGIWKTVAFGVYLGDESEHVLLPRKEVPEGAEAGESLRVFVYRDSDDRLIATVKTPLVRLGKMAVLKVKQITRVGAFLDWGLDKDLLLPYKEQTEKVHEGQMVPVVLYIDKSDRLAATMHVYRYLVNAPGYEKDQTVEGTVIQINPQMGVFLAVDGRYFGMIPIQEVTEKYALGDTVHGRVARVRDDGKLVIAVREKAWQAMGRNSEKIWQLLEKNGGRLPYGDKSDPVKIRGELSMSKAEFKRAAGHLLKEGRIEIGPYEIKKV